MRILYIHQFFATRQSSLGLIRSYEFAKRMIAEGHEVVMVTSSSRLPDEFQQRAFHRGEIDGIDVRSVRVAYSNYMGYTRRIWSFALFTLGATWLALKAPRPDVVFATSTPLTAGIPGWLVAVLRGVPFVFEVRDLWPEAAIQMGSISRRGPVATAAKRLERLLYRRAAAVVALSPGMVAGVVSEGIEPSKVHMVPNSSDLDLFSPGPKDRALVGRFGLTDKFVIGYAGAIGPSNALESQVPDAARILQERGRDDIVFLIVGEGRSLPLLREAKERHGLDNMLLAGPLPKKDVPRVTRTADVLMVLFDDKPILATNSPNKLFDALASGRATIVNQPGWTRELVEGNACGMWVPAGDGAALADAAERLADDRALVERMGDEARALAERSFSRDELAHRLIAVLEEAVTTGRD